MTEQEVACLKRAAAQFGVVTRAGALRFLSVDQLRSRLASKAWVRMFPSVYRVEGAPTSWRQSLEALSLWAGPKAALSHATAAAVHGLRGFGEGALEVTAPYAVRAPKGVVVHRALRLSRSDVSDRSGDPRVTSVPRTLADLAATTGLRELRDVIDHALRVKKTTLGALVERVEASKNKPGVKDLRLLLREFEGAGGPTESELEARVLDLIVSNGLPRPRTQRVVWSHRQVRRVDFCFEAQRVVIEADGYAFHASVDCFEDDRRRNNQLLLKGFRVLHWTWAALKERPEELLNELFALLA